MYNDTCKTDACCAPEPIDSMKNIVIKIYDQAMKTRQVAYDIYKKLFGEIPSDPICDKNEIECAFDTLVDISRTEGVTLEILHAVIGRIGE